MSVALSFFQKLYYYVCNRNAFEVKKFYSCGLFLCCFREPLFFRYNIKGVGKLAGFLDVMALIEAKNYTGGYYSPR